MEKMKTRLEARRQVGRLPLFQRRTREGEPQSGSGGGQVQLSGQVTVDTEVRTRGGMPRTRKEL